MKIAVFEVDDIEEEALKSKLLLKNIKYIREPLSLKNVNKYADYDAIVIFIHSKMDVNMLNRLPKLKFIATMSTGFDHIDINACREREIIVSNVPGYGEITVAEHTFALILSISRRVVDSVDRVRKGDFSNKGLCGFDISNKTIGIIGTGKIGMHVIRIAYGFGMKILAFSRHKNEHAEKLYGVQYVTLEKLLGRSDIISLHATLTDETFHMISMKNIQQIKKGAVLINTARGALIETSAIIKALEKNIFSYVGLDVLEEECTIKEEKELLTEAFLKKCDLKTILANHILLRHERVLITPHNGFNSKEALETINDKTVENIRAFLKRKKANIVS